MTVEVSLIKCPDYEDDHVKKALLEALNEIDGLSFLKPGMKVLIKPNLVSFIKPEAAATTHPQVLCRLIDILTERGAEVLVGDSPGGLFNSVFVNRVYKATGMNCAEECGAALNQNFNQAEADFPEGKSVKVIPYTAYIDEADAIINLCKLKTHGMMGLSNAVKNLFGLIPGTLKAEFHFKYPNHRDFANMLIDINEKFRPVLCISDAITGMEGNGPTAGTPKHIGIIAASKNPYKLDSVCASIIGLTREAVPTLDEACLRGLGPASPDEVVTNLIPEDLKISDFELIPRKSITFSGYGKSPFSKLYGAALKKCISSYPLLKKEECIGCEECFRICPAKAIKMKNHRPVIDRKDCINCFCCQEFCPEGALVVKRPFIARLLNK